MKRIVLCRPLGPRNVGSVLRAALNFGPAEVCLVAPRKRSILIHPDFIQMAHGVDDVERRVRIVPTLAEALADTTGSVGFTARPRGHARLEDWRAASPAITARAADPGELLALVFGSEEGGLTSEELEPLESFVRLPTSSEHTSINLATTVAIVLSTIFFASAPSAHSESRTPITGRDRAFLLAKAREVLGDRATTEAARRDVRDMVERVFSRAPLETRDARAWHLLLRALGDERTPGDFGVGMGEL
jgi:TrmH family RNA methyltransferase